METKDMSLVWADHRHDDGRNLFPNRKGFLTQKWSTRFVQEHKKKYKNWKIQSCEKIRTVYESLEFFKHFWTLGDLTLNIWKLKKVFLKCCPKFDLKRMQLLVRMNHIFSYIKWLKPHTGESHSVHMIRTLMPGILPRLNLRCLDRSAPDCWSEGEENDEFQRAVRGSQNQGCCHLRVWKRI